MMRRINADAAIRKLAVDVIGRPISIKTKFVPSRALYYQTKWCSRTCATGRSVSGLPHAARWVQGGALGPPAIFGLPSKPLVMEVAPNQSDCQGASALLHRSCISSRTGFPRCGLEFPCLVITVVFLVLGSLTPFQIDFASLEALHAGGGLSFWSKCNIADACVNLLIYIPLGASLFALMRGRFESNVAKALTITCGAGLSIGLELGQLARRHKWAVLFGVSVGCLLGSSKVYQRRQS